MRSVYARGGMFLSSGAVEDLTSETGEAVRQALNKKASAGALALSGAD